MPNSEARPGRAPEARLVVGVVLFLVYALPLFAPPSARPFVAPTGDASLIGRVFPYVPVWWVAGRLLALLAGAAVIASLVRQPVVRSLRRLESDAAWATRSASTSPVWTQYAALLAAAIHVGCVPFVARLPLVGQSLYMVWLVVPALLLGWGRSRPVSRATDVQPNVRAALWGVGAILVFWLATRLLISWHSPRAANVVDMWRMFAGLTEMVRRGGNFLVESVGPRLPGVNAVPFFMQGLPALQAASILPSLGWLQVVNTLWLAIAAAALAVLVAIVVGPASAPVATAVLLFSPFMLLGPISPTPVFVGPLFTALPALLLVCFLRTGSTPILALFGSVAGLGLTNPSLSVVTGLVLLLAALRLWRGPRVPLPVVITALLSLLAAVLPSIPGPGTIRQMIALYSSARHSGQTAVLEATVLGQLPVKSATFGWEGGRPPGPLDIPIATLLSPFAMSRAPMRLCGDALFDPFGAGLAAVGLAVCLRHALRDGTSALLLAFLAATLVTGFVSDTDQPSVLRLMGAPVAMALIAAVGFASIQTTLRGTRLARQAAVGAVFAIMVSGMLIFDVVNPRILRASSLGLLVDVLDERDVDRTALLTDRRETVYWRYVDEIATHVPKHPIRVVQIEDQATSSYELLFWSPAVEETAGMTARVCELWPDAALYTILDKAGVSRLYAARPKGTGWAPAVPKTQWSLRRCADREQPADFLPLAGWTACAGVLVS